MGDKTKIEWTDATWNPITGCSVVSPGCTNCYAMRLAGTRLRHHPSRAGLTDPSKAGPVWNGQVRFNEQWLDQPLRWKRPRRIFVCAHGDLFHENAPDEWIDKVFAVMVVCPQHTFQCLTKRADRMRAYCSDEQTPFRVARQIDAIQSLHNQGPEEIRPVVGYPGYFASSHGFIFSEKRGRRRRISQDAGKQGHQRVRLYRDDGDPLGDRLLVHRVILETFIGPPLAPSAQGRHRDGDPSNNAVSNLLWGDQETNWDDSRRHGTHRRYSKLQPWQVREIKERAKIARENADHIARVFDISATQVRNILTGKQWAVETPIEWPIRNCWLGTSVEDQKSADERIPHLLDTPAAVKWVSYEPALGPVDFHLARLRGVPREHYAPTDLHRVADRLHWIICGGESGPGARHMNPDWARSVRDQCHAAGVAFFMKQMAKKAPIPDDLMVREYPDE